MELPQPPHPIYLSSVNDDERRKMWRNLIEIFRESGLSQKEFSKEHGLKIHHLSYYYRKWYPYQPQAERVSPRFVQLESSTSITNATGIIIKTPNGYEINLGQTIATAELLKLLKIIGG